ncbi:hypothetical protein BDW22DRAFT_1350710 [Trametopsis cervina]|nr:hypothetical protein BDW22DRAFT_1350710 [Trametopsis cervina]
MPLNSVKRLTPHDAPSLVYTCAVGVQLDTPPRTLISPLNLRCTFQFKEDGTAHVFRCTSRRNAF